MTKPSVNLRHLSDEQLAVDPRIGMRRLAFEFLLQQEYFSIAAMMVTRAWSHRKVESGNGKDAGYKTVEAFRARIQSANTASGCLGAGPVWRVLKRMEKS